MKIYKVTLINFTLIPFAEVKKKHQNIHCTKNEVFPLRISSGNCGFGHSY